MHEIQSRVPYATYRAIDGVNMSRLKEIRRSPLHYKSALTAPDKETRPLRLGTAAHCAVLEPERYEQTYAIWKERTDAGRLRPRNGKDYDTFCRHNEGKLILTIDEHDDAMVIQRAVRNDATAMQYLASGDPEVTMLWERDGRRCKGRLDWLTRVQGMTTLVGLKTSRDCRDFVFNVQAAKLGYPLSWAWYYDGHRAITGRDAKVVEIVVESAPPHAVATYVITPDIIEQARAEYELLLELLAKCEAANSWPGPVQGEQRLEMPRWWNASDDDGDLANELGLEV